MIPLNSILRNGYRFTKSQDNLKHLNINGTHVTAHNSPTNNIVFFLLYHGKEEIHCEIALIIY